MTSGIPVTICSGPEAVTLSLLVILLGILTLGLLAGASFNEWGTTEEYGVGLNRFGQV